MLRCVLRAKIHNATVTDANLEYEGSITIDEALLEKADMRPFEMVMVNNLNNGERFETYVIAGKENSGEICLNGPAARKGVPGDRLIIFSFAYVDEKEMQEIVPTIVTLKKDNQVLEVT